MTHVRTRRALPTEGRGFFAKLSLLVVEQMEKWNKSFSVFPDVPVYDTKLFPWVKEIEAAYPDIKKELEEVLKRQEELPAFQEVMPSVGNINQDTKWKSMLFTGYGVTSKKNTKLCPKTWRALKRIPGLQTAMFSIFEPTKHLHPHRGPYNGVLRLHMGLIVPKHTSVDELGIRVDTQKVRWEEGRVEIFDDSYEHEAWNHTDSTRVILFVDFERPLKFPINILNWLITHLAYFTPYIREAATAEKKWEEKFYTA